jgi:hypothetical protein
MAQATLKKGNVSGGACFVETPLLVGNKKERTASIDAVLLALLNVGHDENKKK